MNNVIDTKQAVVCKKLFAILLLSILFISNIVCSYATYAASSTIEISSDTALVGDICYKANDVVGEEILDFDDQILRFNNYRYSKLTQGDKKLFMEAALKQTTASRMSAQTKNRVYNFIADQDTAITAAMKYLSADVNADFVSARKWFQPFTGVIGTAMGFISLIIFVSLALSIMIDLAYLALPMVKVALDRPDRTKPWLASTEAWQSTKELELHPEKTLLAIYLKKRLIMLLVLAVCLGYLLSGRIYQLVIYVMDAFQIG